MGTSGGSRGAGGYNFQAQATAFVYAHVLACRPLTWLPGASPMPMAVASETGGPGDDIRIECRDGTAVEIQVKGGLRRTEELWGAVLRLVRGLDDSPSLYGVLLVDSQASGPVKNDLREDVPKAAYGSVDGLKGITIEFLEKLDKAGLTDLSVLRRFAIRVRDFYEGSDGHENAMLMLSGVAEHPEAAWAVLVTDGYESMENRGRRDAEALANLLSKKGVALSAESSQPAVTAQIYRNWLVNKASTFYVPGAGVSLPIGKAWAKLEARGGSKAGEPARAQDLEEWIASYREWGRLALRERWAEHDGTFEADHVPLAGDRVVVVGGPGAGKSTLQWRLANRLSGAGENVCHVRLPLVADRLGQGKTFQEAVLELGAANSGLEESKLLAVLAHPGYLLADGLDECDPSRVNVARELSEWAAGHPRSRVVVTTRPVGHNPGLLPGWRHLELLPLDEGGGREHARNVLEELYEEPDTVEDALNDFWTSVKESETAKRAAGNPLLLGFLVRLFVDSSSFGIRRAQLYGQIVRQIRDREPRHGRSEAKISLAVADRALEKIGWLLQQETIVSGQEVAEELGEELAAELDLPNLAAKQKAEECLTFWEERGLLERLTAGSREALMFVHAALGEYAAARYASRMDEETLIRWITEVRRSPRWREVVLLAAGVGIVRPVIETLLSFHDPQDPVGEEMETAAHALAEVPELPVDLVPKVIEALRERLTGSVPAVIFEAAESALGVAREVPAVVGPALRSLTDHTQFATRLAVVRLLLECGTEHVDSDALERAMEEFLLPNQGDYELPQRRGIAVWDFQDQIIHLGIKHLLQSRPEPEIMSLVERASLRGMTSEGAHSSLAQFLDEEGYEELAETAAKGSFYTPRRSRVAWDWEKWRRVKAEDLVQDCTFLEAVLDAVGGVDEEQAGRSDAEPESVASLIHGMEILEYRAGSWDLMLGGDDPVALRAVLRGGIAAVGLDPKRLAAGAARLLKDLNEVDLDTQSYRRLLSDLPRVPVEARWERAADLELPVEDLLRALRHPSVAVAGSAAQLIAHGAGAPRAKDLLAGVLKGAPEHTYEYVALLAPRVWAPDEAIKHLSAALEDGITTENRHLLGPLTKLPEAQGDERVTKALLAGIWSENPRIATSIAEETLNLDNSIARELELQLEEALEHWTKRGTSCEKHGGVLHGDESCPKCRTIPPSPRAALIRCLGEVDRLDLKRLIALCTDGRSDVREVAAKLVANKAAGAEALPDLLGQVGTGKLPLAVLREVLALPPARLRPVKEALVGLLVSRSAEVRETVVGALPTPGWLDPAEATTLARTALEDPEDSGVRDRAVETLRTLERA